MRMHWNLIERSAIRKNRQEMKIHTCPVVTVQGGVVKALTLTTGASVGLAVGAILNVYLYSYQS